MSASHNQTRLFTAVAIPGFAFAAAALACVCAAIGSVSFQLGFSIALGCLGVLLGAVTFKLCLDRGGVADLADTRVYITALRSIFIAAALISAGIASLLYSGADLNGFVAGFSMSMSLGLAATGVVGCKEARARQAITSAS